MIGVRRAYIADAGSARLATPTAQLLPPSRSMGIAPVAPSDIRNAVVALHGSEQSDAMALFIPGSLRLRSLELGGQFLAAPPGWHEGTYLVCLSRDCRDERVSLSWTGSASSLEFAERRYGLPAFGAPLEQARPQSAMPSQAGDEVILTAELPLTAPTDSSTAR
jgi:hypothetical protein